MWTDNEDFGFFSYIHEPSFFKLLSAGKAPRSLTAMMIVCTIQYVPLSMYICGTVNSHVGSLVNRLLRILDEPTLYTRNISGDYWTPHIPVLESLSSWQVLTSDEKPICADVAQALMLARLYEPCRGRFKSAWMMWATAVR